MTAIFVFKCFQAVYQAVRDVRYVRFLVALLYWGILLVVRFLCGFCGCSGPEPRVLWKTKYWVYTRSLAWETDRNAANRDFHLPDPVWQQQCKYGLKAYEHDNVTYYVDDEYAQRLRFYLAVREAGNAAFFLEARKLLPGRYIVSHKSSAGDYYEECMSGCSFRAVECQVVVDPETPMPNLSRLLAVVSLGSLIAQTENTTSLIILVIVTVLDVTRSFFQPCYAKCSAKLKCCVRSVLSFFERPTAEYLIGLLESMNESMNNCSQYTFSYARLPQGQFALLGNGSRVHKSCDHVVMEDGEYGEALRIKRGKEKEGSGSVSEDSNSQFIEFEKVQIKVYRELESNTRKSLQGSSCAPEEQPKVTYKISLRCKPRAGINMQGIPYIDMRGEDHYEGNDWEFVKRRIEFAAEYQLFPLWSLDDHKAHCKEIKYDFFNGRYHKGCVIRDIQGTRVVGGDFELDTFEEENLRKKNSERKTPEERRPLRRSA